MATGLPQREGECHDGRGDTGNDRSGDHETGTSVLRLASSILSRRTEDLACCGDRTCDIVSSCTLRPRFFV